MLNQFLYSDPIPITSPDQFVPTFLASFTEKGVDQASSIFDDNAFGVGLYGNVQGYTTIQLPRHLVDKYRLSSGLGRGTANQLEGDLKERFRSAIREMLPDTYPKQYSTLLPFRALISGDVNYSAGTTRVFSGDMGSGAYVNHYTFVLPGFYATVDTSSSFAVPDRPHYFDVDSYVNLTRPAEQMLTRVLVLVKAKHIPVMRASTMLQIASDIPTGDMRLLVGQDVDAGSQFFVNLFKESGISNLRISGNLQLEYHPVEYINKYLFGEHKSITKEEVLTRATKLVSGELVLADVNI